MAEINLKIEKLGLQGDGLAASGGKPCFVAGALAGEEVLAETLPTKDKTIRARVTQVLKASPDRVKAPCPHFLTCGGCKLQHFAIPTMTAWKENNLRGLFAREGLSDLTFFPPIVTGLGTRRRARFAARHVRQGVVLGFNQERSETIIDLSACPVLVPEIVNLLPKLREALATWLPPHASCDLHITALGHAASALTSLDSRLRGNDAEGSAGSKTIPRHPREGGDPVDREQSLPGAEIDVMIIGGRPLDLASRELLGAMAEQLNLARISWRKEDRSPIEPVAHRRPLSLTFGETQVAFPPASFLQATPPGEAALIAFAREATEGAKHLLDLFCGLGGFGLSIPAKRKSFADMDGPAIASLEKATRGKAAHTVSERNLAKEPFTMHELAAFDAVIFDPPRGGAKAQAAHISQSEVSTVVAISCDPASLARDAKLLLSGGYRLEKLQMVDQFLFSPHTEVAALFKK